MKTIGEYGPLHSYVICHEWSYDRMQWLYGSKGAPRELLLSFNTWHWFAQRIAYGFVYHENNRELWSHTLPSYHPGFSITSYNDSTGQRVVVEMCWSVYADPLLRKISKLPPSMILLIQCSNTLLSIVQVLYIFCITFPYLQKSLTCPTLKTDHSSITSTASARNIGVMFYNCDQMRDHITSVCHAPHFHLWNIGSIHHYLTIETYATLV